MWLQLELWDTAGIERFATLSASYFHNAAAAIICYSSADRNSFNMLSQHLLEIVMHSKTARVFLCATKVDLSIHDGITDSDVEAFREQCDTAVAKVFYTSSKNGDGLVEMFNDIAETLVSERESRRVPIMSAYGGRTVALQQKDVCCAGSTGS